jgi:hypothetical protein
MIELDCPESCQYLAPARDQAIVKEREHRSKAAASEGRIYPQVDMRLLPLILAVERAIIQIQREQIRDLQDFEVQQAIENTLKNLETESSGLIYEHRSPSIRVQELSEAIRAAPEKLAKGRSIDSAYTRTDVVTVLKYLQFRIESQLRRADKEARGFLRTVALFHPWSDESKTARLIV